MAQDNPNQRFAFSEAILLALLTIISYVSAYSYECGYAAYFGIPVDFIELSLDVALRAGIGILFFTLLIAFTINLPIILLHGELTRQDDLRRRAVIVHVFFLIGLVTIIRGFGFVWWMICAFLAVVVLLDVLVLLVPYLVDRKSFPEEAPFFHRIARQAGDEPHSAYSILERVIDRRLNLALFAGLPLLMFFAYAAGVGSARNESAFRVSDSDNLVLIRRYGDSFALRSLSDDSKLLRDPVVLWSREQLSNRSFRRVEIEQLNVEDGLDFATKIKQQ